MGLFANAAKQIKQEDEGKFRPLELCEINVQAIFNRCLATKESKEFIPAQLFFERLGYEEKDCIHINFDKDLLLKNKRNIEYLYGQLSVIYTDKVQSSIQDFLNTYLGNVWTNSREALLQLLYLGSSTVVPVVAPFFKGQPDTTSIDKSIKPTLSPKDPNFPAWWEAHKAEWEE